jgi:peptide/nickel transport system permease protein
VWQRFLRRPLGVVGLIVLSLVLLGVLLVPAISPFDIEHIDVDKGLILGFSPFGGTSPTGYVHWLGNDRDGRDLAVRLASAGRITLTIAFLSTFFAMLLGVALGLLAGFYGGWVDTVLMRLADFLLAVPAIPLYVMANSVLAATGVVQLIVSITNNDPVLNTMVTIVLVFVLISWAGVARQVRIAVLKMRSLSYVEATQALGAGNRRIIFSHILPNSAATIFTAGTLMLAEIIIFESSLSYLFLGVGKLTPSWGFLLNDATATIFTVQTINPFEDTRAYTIILPTFLIFLTVLSINFIGDTLRRALDPKAD